MSVESHYDWVLKAQTPIWTGGADMAQSERADRFIPTGLIGSVRWWFEVLARGLGGSACDPSDPRGRCSNSNRRTCVVCELFGCTGWGRKFRLLVLGPDGKPQSASIQKNSKFTLRFIPFRPIRPEEWTLIDVTLRLIAEYGALGGKTVYKPSDEANRQSEPHHWDYGLVEIKRGPKITSKTLDRLNAYVALGGWWKPNQENAIWSSLDNFWCVKDRYLARQNVDQSTFNSVIGRLESKFQSDKNDSWSAGRRAGRGRASESKKVFSFKDPKRTFGFLQPGTKDLNHVKQKLKSVWPDFDDGKLLGRAEILETLLNERLQNEF